MRNNFTKTCPERQAEKGGKQTPDGLKGVYLEEESILLKEKKSLGFEKMSIDEFLAWTPDLSEDQSKASRTLDLQKRFRQLEKNRKVIFAEEVVMEELNAKHAVVHTDRFYILTEKEDPVLGGTNFTLESKQSFKDMYENQTIEIWSGKKTTKAKLWLESADRRQYDGIVFNPNRDEVSTRYYNIWKGFAINPEMGSCKRYRYHVENVICNGNQEYFNYLWKWCARLVQKPHLLGEVVPVLMGAQGIGKNTFVDALGKIFGIHYLPLDNIQLLLGQFNFHMINAVFIHANEAIWGGNRKEIGKLKSLITEKSKIIEGKGKDAILVPNFTHLILSSNEDWPVHLDPDDRRFFVLKVSNQHKEDKSYFKAIHDELENGGINALLYELLNEDITHFDPRNIPQNIEAFEIKLLSASSSERYIYEALNAGCFDIGNTTPTESWKQKVEKRSIFNDYYAWCAIEGIAQVDSAILGLFISRLIPSAGKERPRVGGERIQYYVFPELNKAREEFQKIFKADSTIWD